MKNNALKYGMFFLVLAAVAAWSVLVYIYGAESLINYIGIQNSYIFLFFIATSGISSFASMFFYATLISLAAAGLNPVLLGLVGGVGATIGDSVFYYLGLRGGDMFSGRYKKHLDKIHDYINNKPEWKIKLFTFLYAGYSPFPNDILTVSLGISKIKYRKIFLPILAANISSAALISYIVLISK
jgi:membrane protein DedA with SNARE-associated domain